jgi:hypothetical protein
VSDPLFRDNPITPELLAAIDPDPAVAEERLEKLRSHLEWWFEKRRRCIDPQGAAGEAILRALRQVQNGASIGPAGFRGYTFGVAKYVEKECQRNERRLTQLEPEAWSAVSSSSRDYERVEQRVLLEQVRKLLSKEEFAKLSRYYTEDDHTQQSRALGVTPAYLRLMVHRIRKKLWKTLMRTPRS